jgi:mono/diheme cytochrome c family protein
MRRFLVAAFVLVLPLADAGIRAAFAKASAPRAAASAQASPPKAQSGAPAPAAAATAGPRGKAETGKAIWALGNTSCRNCHGGDAEGAFGPTLAGRKLTYEWIRNYVRTPQQKMPAYIPSELTNQEIADLAAYFDSMPQPEKPAAWRTELPANPPLGQQLAIALIGCAQCHGATLETPRHGLAQVNGDWEWFKHQVYDHTVAIREHWSQLDPSLPNVTPGPAGPPGRNRVRMGNYDRTRLPEPFLKEIFDWAKGLGYLPPLAGQITAGPADASGAAYTMNVVNAGVKDKGVAAEDVTIALALPAGTTVVSATGTGYQGVKADAKAKGNVAVWRVPRLAPTERQTFTFTLSTPAKTLRGTVRWAKPVVKADPEVVIAFGGGRGGGAGGAGGVF